MLITLDINNTSIYLSVPMPRLLYSLFKIHCLSVLDCEFHNGHTHTHTQYITQVHIGKAVRVSQNTRLTIKVVRDSFNNNLLDVLLYNRHLK